MFSSNGGAVVVVVGDVLLNVVVLVLFPRESTKSSSNPRLENMSSASCIVMPRKSKVIGAELVSKKWAKNAMPSIHMLSSTFVAMLSKCVLPSFYTAIRHMALTLCL